MLAISVGPTQYPVTQQPSPVEEMLASFLSESGLTSSEKVRLVGDLPSGLLTAMCRQMGATIVGDDQLAHQILAYPNGEDGERRQAEVLSSARGWLLPKGRLLVALGSKHGWAEAKDLLGSLGCYYRVFATLNVPLEAADQANLVRWEDNQGREPRIFRTNCFDGHRGDYQGWYQQVRIVAVQVA